ncbi:SDR family oxidoreductase [Shimia abyssi]|uniref:SDR family oxidoreductase n=1 Tax=Shimia abyssi TaxID=1662395 RepID=UPI000D0E1AA9|nr:SDR family oxidoreductase [Shimia abyssi]
MRVPAANAQSLPNRNRVCAENRKARADFEARQPMKRLGTPEEVAEMACFFASERAAFTTGGEYMIDGGWTI